MKALSVVLLVALSTSVAFFCPGFMNYAEAKEPPNSKPFQEIWDAITNLQNQINNIQLTPGPQGPQGEPGPQGIQGPPGPKGDPGDPSWDEERIISLEDRIAYLENIINPPPPPPPILTCAYFQGGQYLTAVDSPSLSITGDLTIEMWINMTTLPNIGFALLGKFAAGQEAYRTYLWNGSQEICFGIGNSINPEPLVNWTPVADTWYHLAIVYHASAGEVTFYVNGVQQGATQNIADTSIPDTASELRIGATFNETLCFEGLIDEIRIWAAERTPEEIFLNFERELVGNETNLVAYWKFNGDALDSTPNGNYLTNHNGVTFVAD